MELSVTTEGQLCGLGYATPYECLLESESYTAVGNTHSLQRADSDLQIRVRDEVLSASCCFPRAEVACHKEGLSAGSGPSLHV
jgi:hypothetical protein